MTQTNCEAKHDPITNRPQYVLADGVGSGGVMDEYRLTVTYNAAGERLPTPTYQRVFYCVGKEDKTTVFEDLRLDKAVMSIDVHVRPYVPWKLDGSLRLEWTYV